MTERESTFLQRMPKETVGRSGRMSRRRFLLAGGLLGAGLAGSYWHAFHFSPYSPVVTRRRLFLDGLPPAFEGLKVVHLTDLHHSDIVPLSYLEECIDTANSLDPDLVVLTGDYITMDSGLGRTRIRNRYVAPLEGLLRRIRARLGIYAVMGNHDVAAAYHEVVALMDGCGIPLLQDESTWLEDRGHRLALVGLRDFGTQIVDRRRVFARLRAGEPALVLMHNPDFFPEMDEERNALIFAGHTHGGQVRIPFYGAVSSYIPSRYGNRYAEGVFRKGNLTMFVNRGLGVIRTPVRINCRPEIALVTLAAARPS
jgi:uncharacterized protein